MIKNKKIVLVISSFFLFFVLCYQFSISNTLELKKEFNKLKEQETFFRNTPRQLYLLTTKEKYYDSILNKYQINGRSIQSNLLKTININASNSNLKVISFIEPHVYNKNDIVFKTYQFSVEGNYNDILKLVHQLEQKTKFGEITNLFFEKKKNFKTGKFYLQAHILLKSFG